MYASPQALQGYMQYHVILDCFIKVADWIIRTKNCILCLFGLHISDIISCPINENMHCFDFSNCYSCVFGSIQCIVASWSSYLYLIYHQNHRYIFRLLTPHATFSRATDCARHYIHSCIFDSFCASLDLLLIFMTNIHCLAEALVNNSFTGNQIYWITATIKWEINKLYIWTTSLQTRTASQRGIE